MTVSGLPNKITLSCSGTQTNFDFDFGYLNNSDIQVYLPNIDGDANDSNKQTEGSDYDLISTDKSAGGTVAFKSAPPDTKEVFIIREVPLTQTVPFKPNTNFPEKLIETGLDKLTMGLQQLDERVGRAITFPPNSDTTGASIPEPEANKALKWDADGKNLINSTYDVDTAVAESAASAAASAASAAESAASAAGAKQSETNAQGYEDQAEYWAKQAAAAIQQRVLNELIMSPVPLISAALHLADGTLLRYGANAQYIDYMIEYKKTYPGAFVIESEWQRLVSENGVCGKFVLDESAKTLRLPKLSGYLEGTLEESELGSFTKAKLPNIKGSLEVYLRFGPDNTGGAFKLRPASDGIKNVTGQIYNASNTTDFDASLSNPIYSDDATTVQTDSTKVYYYLVVATGVKTDVQIDINKIITDINQINNDLIGKVDASDMVEVPCIVESYLSDDGLNGYITYSNKLCHQWGLVTHGRVQKHEDTINLLKPYRDTKYNALAVQYGVDASNSISACGLLPGTYTVSSFKYYHTGAADGVSWQAIGYLA